MEKSIISSEVEKVYRIVDRINNIALVKSSTDESGLINVQTGEVVVSFKKCNHAFNSNGFFYLESYCQNEFGVKYVTIYDCINEKVVFENWKSHIGDIYYNPSTSKFHLFVNSSYREGQEGVELFKRGHDDIKSYDSDIVLTYKGKKALYFANRGLVTEYEYKDIIGHGSVFIFTKNVNDDCNKMFFVYNLGKNNEFKSSLYDKVWCYTPESTVSGKLVYCQNDSKIAIYYINGNKCKIGFTINSHSIKCLSAKKDVKSYSDEFIFRIQDPNTLKYGLILNRLDEYDEIKPNAQENLLSLEYDRITEVKGTSIPVLILEKDGKKGIFVPNKDKRELIDTKYDDITYIYNDCFALTKDGISDIIKLPDKKMILSQCKIISYYGLYVIYEKNGKKGIKCYKSCDNSDNYGYDDIEKEESSDYYLVTKDGKKGLLYGTKVVLKPEYDLIQVKINSPSNCICLRKKDKFYDISVIDNGKVEHKVLSGDGDVDISYHRDVMVVKNSKHTYIYSYKHKKPLCVFPADVKVEAVLIPSSNGLLDECYIIDGINYLYHNNGTNAILFKTPPVRQQVYTAHYVTDYGEVFIQEENECLLDAMMDQIEDAGHVDKIIDGLNKGHSKVYTKYSDLNRMP